MLKKGVRLHSKKITSISIILNLLLSMFAFTFIIWSAGGVSAEQKPLNQLNKGDQTDFGIDGGVATYDHMVGNNYLFYRSDGKGALLVGPDGYIKRSGTDTVNVEDSTGSGTPPAAPPGGTQPPANPNTQKLKGSGVQTIGSLASAAGGVKSVVGLGSSGTKIPAFQGIGEDGQLYKIAENPNIEFVGDTPALTTTRVSDGAIVKMNPEYLSNVEYDAQTKTMTVDLGKEAGGVQDYSLVSKASAKSYEDPFGLGIGLGSGSSGFFFSNVLQGVMWAGVAVGVIQLLGGVLGLDKGMTDALSTAAFAGIMAGKTAFALGGSGEGGATGLLGGGISSLGATVIGVAAAVIIFALTYKSSSSQTVTFQCKVWQPQKGGADCEKCNLDQKNYPCTEYKCRSLGGACQLLNKGTGEEKCSWIDARDVTSPIITPNYENISEGYQYANVHIRPPGLGMEIKNLNVTAGNEAGCIEAFYPVQFGVSTNEPTRCKIDYNHTKSYEDMQYDFGESSTYKYNHTETLSLPGPTNINAESPELKNDGVYNLFIRCEDPNGNANEDEFAIKFCVNPGPDTTPARIEATSLLNGMPISYGTDNLNITVYTNEPADCKWSHEDKDYGVMENTMTCARSVTEFNTNQLYPCNGKLNEIKDREENNFYFRCKDQPQAVEADRNVNEESYKFTISGTQPLNILRAGPNGTIMGSTSIVPVTLEVETGNGYKDGDATCYYSTTGAENDYVKFFETGSFVHRQRQDLARGEYTYYFKCLDLGGNADYNKTRIRIDVDDTAPKVIRVKHDSGESSVCGAAGCLQITTNEESTCVYSTTTCNYELVNGIKMPYEMTKTHYAEWNTDYNYYIKCTDKASNQPTPTGCSMIVKAYNHK